MTSFSQTTIFLIRYFVEERKSALGLPADYEPQRGSESDLNALLTLYSHPPDPVMDPRRAPPPGAPTYQGVPQAYTQPPTLPMMYQQRRLRHQLGESSYYGGSSPSLLGVSPTASLPPTGIGSPYGMPYAGSPYSGYGSRSGMMSSMPMTSSDAQSTYQGISGLMRRTPSPLLGPTSAIDPEYYHPGHESGSRGYVSAWAGSHDTYY